MVFERPPDEIGNNVAGEIVVGRTEAAGKNEQISSLECVRDNRFQDVTIITRDRFALQIDSELIQSLGDEKGVGVHVRRRQHFAADGNHFCS